MKYSRLLPAFVALTLVLETVNPANVFASTYDSLTNTAFDTVDDAGYGETGYSIRFGSTLQEELKFDSTLGTFTFTDDLKVVGSISGSSLKIDGRADIFGGITTSGSIISKGTISGANLIVSGTTSFSGSVRFEQGIQGPLSGNTLRVSGGGADVQGPLSASGAVHFDANLSINDDAGAVDAVLNFGNASGNQSLALINATQAFQFSKGINVLGSISGSSLVVSGASSFSGATLFRTTVTTKGSFSGASFYGSGLGDCANTTTSKVVYDPATGKFICATDQTGGGGGLSFTTASGVFVNQGGDTMTGQLSIRPTAGNAVMGLNVAATMSGNALRVSNNAAVHGSLSSSGTIRTDSGVTINDFNSVQDGILTFGNATAAQTLKFRNTSQLFEFSRGINVLGSMSGRSLSVSGASSFSGAALFRTTVTTKGAFSGSSFYGSGLGDCANTTTSKIVYNPATGKFICATDQGGGGGGISFSTASGVFVNQGGDTMTGHLSIRPTAGNTVTGLSVAGAMSGTRVHAVDRLASSGVLVLHTTGKSQPTFYANGGQMVGINTGSPHSSLTASGTFATSTRLVTATGSINGGDQIIFASGASMITLTLPSAVGINGRQYTIKKTSVTTLGNVRTVVIATTSNQTIDRVSQWRLMQRGERVTVISDGTNWQVVDSSAYGINGFRAMGTTMNQWYGTMSTATAHTTAILTTTATIRVLPFVAEKVTTINGMSVSVQTTAVGAEVRLAIYRDSGRGFPDTLVVDAGTVATTTTGHRTICPSGCTTTGNNTFPVTVQPGLYWLAINNNSIAHTLRGYALAQLISLGKPNGFTTTTNVGWNIANAYGAYPTQFPVTAAATAAIPLPVVTVRIQD
jgi:hypothetical protein